MESGAEGANSVNRVSRWPTCRFERVERGGEVQSTDSKSDRVSELGRRGGGRLRGQMKMRRRMDSRMEVVLQNCLDSLE